MLLQGIPEQIAVVTLAFVIAKIPLKWNKVILIGIILAFSAYIVRLLPIPFGIHLILLIVLLFIALLWLGEGDFSLSLIACLLSFLALAIFEYVCLSLLMPVFGLTLESLSTELVKRIVIGEFHVLLLFITAFLLNKFYKKDVE